MSMLLLSLQLLLPLCLSLPGEDKLNQLLQLSKQKPLISLTDTTFEYYLAQGPRPYYSLIVLTQIKEGSCKPCEEIIPETNELARQLISQQNILLQQILSSKTEYYPIFMFEVDFFDNRDIFYKIGVHSAPMILLVPPTKTKNEINLTDFFNILGAKNQYILATGRKPKDLIEWLIKIGKSKLNWIQIEYNNFDISKLNLNIILPSLFILPIFIYYSKEKIDKMRHNMLLYAMISLIVYGFVIGGGMYPLIRNTPFSYIDNGRIVFVSNRSRYQYGAEGYIIGFANVIAGFAVWLYINLQRNEIKENINGKGKGKKVNKVISMLGKVIPVWIPIAALFGGYWVIIVNYTYKNRHYNFGNVGMTG